MKTNGTISLASRMAKTPVGRIWIVSYAQRVAAAELEPRWDDLTVWLEKRFAVAMRPRDNGKDPILDKAQAALERYFSGHLGAPAQIPLALEGSVLQRKVWETVRSIPPGRTITYSELATRARKSGAHRAVGAANGANRCAIFIPCHRVVATSGALQGYGGGIEAKDWLLRHEGVETDGARVIG